MKDVDKIKHIRLLVEKINAQVAAQFAKNGIYDAPPLIKIDGDKFTLNAMKQHMDQICKS